jgi:hypothetical protein
MPLAVASTWAHGEQEGRAVGHAGCPGQRISGTNLRPKWVREDSSRERCLFESHRWVDCFVRSDTLLSVCISSLAG